MGVRKTGFQHLVVQRGRVGVSGVRGIILTQLITQLCTPLLVDPPACSSGYIRDNIKNKAYSRVLLSSYYTPGPMPETLNPEPQTAPYASGILTLTWDPSPKLKSRNTAVLRPDMETPNSSHSRYCLLFKAPLQADNLLHRVARVCNVSICSVQRY